MITPLQPISNIPKAMHEASAVVQEAGHYGEATKYTAPQPVVVRRGGDRWYQCPDPDCTHEVKRMPDYIKHYRGRHDEIRLFVCRVTSCDKEFKDSTTRCRYVPTFVARAISFFHNDHLFL
jgi:hypothetical protein